MLNLTVNLICTIRETLGEKALEQVIKANGEEILDRYTQHLSGIRDLEPRIEALVDIRQREGYMAEYRSEADGEYLFIENHCPICAAATQCQGFCDNELTTFRTVLVDVRGADVPRPDFNAYRQNPASIPTLAAFQVPTINTYSDNAKIPVVYKANLSYTRFINDRIRPEYGSRSVLQISHEDNRGVYVQPTAIVNGAADWTRGVSVTNLAGTGLNSEAERNGGVNGFYGIVDLRVAKKFKFGRTQSLEVSADVFNLGNLFKKDWGVNESLGSQALYALGIPENKETGTAAVPQFDVTKQQFNYRVNNSGIVNPSGNPYQFQLGLRYGF
ncbi:hypothetical protein FQR65_LT17580 [Abscondita terminalis]|nr:hypothetical protein FQR65_LT17580 [Abscondita terminalis]